MTVYKMTKQVLFIVLIFLNIGQNVLMAQSTVEDQPANIKERTEKNLEIIESGQHSPELYATLGYDYFQMGDLAHSILYYEKALMLDAGNVSYQNALSQVKNELPVKITTIPNFFMWSAYEQTMLSLSSATWSFLQMFIFIGLIYFLYRWMLVRPLSKEYLNWLVLVILIIGLILTSLFAYHKKVREKGGQALISMDHQDLYKAADDRSEVVASIGPGNKLYVLDSIGEWQKVQLADKDIGWVRSEKTKEI